MNPSQLLLPRQPTFSSPSSKSNPLVLTKMLLKSSASSLSSLLSPQIHELSSGSSSSSRLKIVRGKTGIWHRVLAVAADNSRPLTGVVFEPFKELDLNRDLDLVPASSNISIARQKFADDCEAAINEQINVEYNVSYVYHAMYAYFDRDNVALKGLAKFFKDASEEEREHAEKLMEYQNKRGGKVKFQPIIAPISDFNNSEKGDALYAMELALALEKLTNEKLLQLHGVASRSDDPQFADFVESEYLTEQVEAIKKISEYVAQLRRIGKGHGVWHFDQMLLREGAAA